MAYDIGRLRQQNLMGGYDQLTPGAGGNYMEENSNPTSPYTPGPGLESIGAQQDRDTILGPTGEPLNQGGIQAPTIDPVGATPTRSNGPTLKETIDAINAGYSPDYTSRDRLNALLNEAPTRQAPGWGRALVAAGMSIKAQDPIATAEKVMYAPYMRDVEEWKTRADPYYKAAELENRQNINERTLVSNAATAYSAAERNRIAQENNESKNQIGLIRANAYRAKQMGAEVKIEQGMVVAVYPDRIEHLGRVPGTSTDAELADIRGKYQVQAAREAAKGAGERSNAAGSEFYTTPSDEIVVGNPRTGQVPPKGSTRTGTDRPPSATNTLETRRQEQDRMDDAYTGDRTTAQKYMTGNSRQGYTWKARPEVGSGKTFGYFGTGVTEADVKAYDDFRSSVDPNYKPPTKGLGPSTRVLNPDGTESTVPKKDGESPNVRYQVSKTDKNRIRRTRDGGKTWEVSTDGGRRWSK